MSDYLETLIATATANLDRLATLGGWPASINAKQSIVGRIPTSHTAAPGLDAGVACALGLIPEKKQRLAAILHAAYTPEAIWQVRREITVNDPDSETAWWLAACSLCQADDVNALGFMHQFMTFQSLAAVPALRQHAARCEFAAMKRRFTMVDGVPFITDRGGLQGAYLLGHDWGVEYKKKYSTFFVGTFRPSLGLEEFVFSNNVDEQGRRLSGPVNGSQQYVKCCSFTELVHVIDLVRASLS